MTPSQYQVRYKALHQSIWKRSSGFLAATGIIASGFTWFAVLANGPLIPAVIVDAFFILSVVVAVTSAVDVHRGLHIELCLEHEGAIFRSSEILAHIIPQLDVLAGRANVKELSGFVLVEDQPFYRIEWRPPDDALPTVQALLRAVEIGPITSDRSKLIQNDLLLIHQALQHARERGKKFTLRLCYGSGAQV